jgi:hypothetical protein
MERLAALLQLGEESGVYLESGASAAALDTLESDIQKRLKLDLYGFEVATGHYVVMDFTGDVNEEHTSFSALLTSILKSQGV